MTGQSDRSAPAAGRLVGDPLTHKALILLYCRVVKPPIDPQLLCVAPRHFAAHLEILKKQCRATSLTQLIRAMDGGDIPPRSVAVTFDDGYADNLENARPLLDRQGVPATVFVVSGALGPNREFWWDDLERILLHSSRLPQTLRLALAGAPHEWHLGDAATCAASTLPRFRGWNVLDKTDPTPRHKAYRELCTLLRSLPSVQRRTALDELSQWASLSPAVRPTHRPLGAADLRLLTDGGLIEVGAHTVSHPVLSACRHPEPARGVSRGRASAETQCTEASLNQPDTAFAEIRESKAALEHILDRPVTSFSYPYGQRCDYTPETVDCVRDSGFACACSAFAGIVRPDTDRFQLPRMIVRDWDGDTFAKHLEQWWSND